MFMATSVMECCGIIGLYRLPPLKSQFKEYCLKRFDDYYIEGVGEFYEIASCAFVICHTSDDQPHVEKYLKEFGFINSASNHNPNSGNTVTMWHITSENFNKLLDEWYGEKE